MLWNFSKSRVWGKVPEEVAIFLEIHKFLYNTVQDKARIASTPKTSGIHSAVSTQYWLVTNGKTGT